jgi:flavin reductase (DIM6/NTAB) family NADH-FMN oxidoreductase RutF
LLRGGSDKPRQDRDRRRGDEEREHRGRVQEVRSRGRTDEHDAEPRFQEVAPAHAHIIDAMTGDELRDVMRRFPAPVAVVTARVDEERYGLTVGSLVSLSLDPPLVGISVGKESSSHEPIRHAGGFAVSLLSEAQEYEARHFARSGVPPAFLWHGATVRDGGRGPLVDGALAWLQCRTRAEHDVGDHTLFVGEVESYELGALARGLVYRDSTYHPA